MSLTPALRNILNKENKHKYGAKRTTCLHGHDHDSRKEALWCLKFHQLQKEGKLKDLRMQPMYELTVNGIHVCRHIPDFFYMDCNTPLGICNPTVVDVKGMPTPEWKLKYKLFCALFPNIQYEVV